MSREQAMTMIAEARRACGTAESIAALLDDYEQDPSDPNALRSATAEELAGVSNGFLSEVCEVLAGRPLEVTGDVLELLPCPCCARRTLTERFDPQEGTGYDICPFCGWEDDGTKLPDSRSGVNHGTMHEYRARLASERNYYFREKWLR